jgi:hypothetical protein
MKRAVLMILDGLRADMVNDELTPHLADIAGRSRWFRRQRSVFPSATRVNSASLSTGCWPASHGLAGNAIALDEGEGLVPVSVGPPEFRHRWRRATGRTLHRPTLAERLRSGPGMQPIVDERHPDVGYDGAGDAQTTKQFCEALLAASPQRYHALWICEPDHSQHALELGSPEHREVMVGADRCTAEVADAVEALRRRGDDVLFIVGTDHGHETVDRIVPVEDLLVEAGFKESPGSTDVVLASSGMGALLYLSEEAGRRGPDIARWMRDQDWSGEVYAGPELEAVGQRSDTALAVAFSMAKRDVPNRFGVHGLGHVVADPFMKGDCVGFGQHGGLGPYETNPLLCVNGGGFEVGVVDYPSRVIDVAPTLLEHLSVPTGGMDGEPLPRG